MTRSAFDRAYARRSELPVVKDWRPVSISIALEDNWVAAFARAVNAAEGWYGGDDGIREACDNLIEFFGAPHKWRSLLIPAEIHHRGEGRGTELTRLEHAQRNARDKALMA